MTEYGAPVTAFTLLEQVLLEMGLRIGAQELTDALARRGLYVRRRKVGNWVEASHYPREYVAADGEHRCRDCGMVVSRYVISENGRRSWRHHPRGRR